MNWQRWFRPGLALATLVTLVAVVLRVGAIGADLSGAVGSRLSAEGQNWASVEASGRDVTIRGTAPSPEAQQLAVRVAGTVRGVHAVTDRSDLLPIASPYAWSAARKGETIELTGSVPSEGARASVLAAARRALPKVGIVDQMTPARGAPAAFGVATAFALTRLGELREGSVSLTDSTLVVSGVAADAAAYREARVALQKSLPQQVVLGPVDILPARADPFVWSANFDGSGVSISGFVPNEVVHELLVTSVKATLPGIPIEDKVAIASGEPPGFAEAAGFAITALDRLSRGGVTLDGLKLDVGGVAKSVDDYEAVVADLAGPLPEGVQVVAADITPAPVSPYGWRGERTDGRVILAGYVPNPQARAEVVAAARSLFGADAIDDRVRVASGEPKMDWVGAIKFALSQLAGLSHGSVELGEKTYAIEGEAATSDTYAAISSAARGALPASLDVTRAEVAPPKASPYRFTAERKGPTLLVAGNVPSDAAHQQILAAIHRKFGAEAVDDRLTFASGEPEDYVSAVTASLQALARMAGGSVELEDREIRLAGSAYYDTAAVEIPDTLASDIPEGFTVAQKAVMVRQDDPPVTADRCRDLLQAALKASQISFDGTKATLASDGLGVVDRVAAAVVRCPGTGVEIGAHSDNEGSASRNRDLTQARAETIAEYLVSAGIERERLTAVGYGETKPIADNGTEQGKAANRRIEFTVTERAGG
jgi:outer membrane protein OmpA-like peptidoglycan-associated protein